MTSTLKRSLSRCGAVLAMAGALAAGPMTAPAAAHHSFAMFDGSIFRVFTGVVYQVSPDANHLQIYFVPLNEERNDLVRNDAGDPVVWVVETVSAAAAAGQGITVASFPPGTIFSVGLHPLRNGRPGGDRAAAGLYRCPVDTPPPPGMHCDDVEGAVQHGPGAIPEEGPVPGGPVTVGTVG